MPIEVDFGAKEKVVGHVNIPSGSLLLADGVFENDLPLNTNHSLTVDLKLDNVRVPVYATMQNGRRFLLIPIDAAQPIEDENENVEVEDRVEMEKEESEEDAK